MAYEYKVLHVQNEMTSSQLNLLGKQGWELVSVTFITQMFTYYLRKAVRTVAKKSE